MSRNKTSITTVFIVLVSLLATNSWAKSFQIKKPGTGSSSSSQSSAITQTTSQEGAEIDCDNDELISLQQLSEFTDDNFLQIDFDGSALSISVNSSCHDLKIECIPDSSSNDTYIGLKGLSSCDASKTKKNKILTCKLNKSFDKTKHANLYFASPTGSTPLFKRAGKSSIITQSKACFYGENLGDEAIRLYESKIQLVLDNCEKNGGNCDPEQLKSAIREASLLTDVEEILQRLKDAAIGSNKKEVAEIKKKIQELVSNIKKAKSYDDAQTDANELKKLVDELYAKDLKPRMDALLDLFANKKMTKKDKDQKIKELQKEILEYKNLSLSSVADKLSGLGLRDDADTVKFLELHAHYYGTAKTSERDGKTLQKKIEKELIAFQKNSTLKEKEYLASQGDDTYSQEYIKEVRGYQAKRQQIHQQYMAIEQEYLKACQANMVGFPQNPSKCQKGQREQAARKARYEALMRKYNEKISDGSDKIMKFKELEKKYNTDNERDDDDDQIESRYEMYSGLGTETRNDFYGTQMNTGMSQYNPYMSSQYMQYNGMSYPQQQSGFNLNGYLNLGVNPYSQYQYQTPTYFPSYYGNSFSMNNQFSNGMMNNGMNMMSYPQQYPGYPQQTQMPQYPSTTGYPGAPTFSGQQIFGR